MKLSLGKKILAMITAPLVAFIFLASIAIHQNWQKKEEATLVKKNVASYLKLSAFIHELQKERGKSMLFLGDKISTSDLVAQRKIVDEKQDYARQSIDGASLPRARKDAALEAFSRLPGIRADVDKKDRTAKVAPRVTQIIRTMIETEVALTREISMNGVDSTMMSVSMLEEAKENAGQLRAALSNILALNNALTPDQLTQIQKLRYGILTVMGSSVLSISDSGMRAVDQFKNSDDWKASLAVYDAVEAKALSGNFGQDANSFFGTITRSIDSLAKITFAELPVIEKMADENARMATKSLTWLVSFSAVLATLLLATALRFTKSLSKKLENLVHSIAAGADSVTNASKHVSGAGTELSSSAIEQAAALQETVSSLQEITAMISKNAENAKRSQDVSSENQTIVRRGSETVTETIQAVEDINQSNQEIVKQIETSNREISQIAKIIAEIGEKTKVINDIVFQTKLLSFNASVEAARAGEHGKGFAVVAEEIGNLARMSGNAAKDISEMLENSIQKVEVTVQNSRSRIETFVHMAKEKVETGSVKAKKCGEILDDVVRNVTNMGGMISEISSASQEQAQGVGEINKAMNQMDQVTQQNAAASAQSANAAEELTHQAVSLQSIVRSLVGLIRGEEGESFAARPLEDQGSISATNVVPLMDKEMHPRA